MNSTQAVNAGEHGHSGEFTIIVNGREKKVAQDKLTFEQIVALAFENPPSGRVLTATISGTFSIMATQRQTAPSTRVCASA